MQIFVSIRNRKALAVDGDPWNGRTLEWSTTSPPPEYNFAFTPVIYDVDAWSDMKAHGYTAPTSGFRPIHMPRSSGAGVILSGIALVLGFALVWHIWWLAVVSFIGMIGTAIRHTFNYDRDYDIPVETVITDRITTDAPIQASRLKDR